MEPRHHHNGLTLKDLLCIHTHWFTVSVDTSPQCENLTGYCLNSAEFWSQFNITVGHTIDVLL